MKKTLIEYFYDYEENRANRPYLHQPFGDRWETYTWAQVGEQARRLATWLKKQCPKKNAHVSVVSKNCREWIIADIAIMMAGFVSVPLYANLKGKDLKEVLELGDVDLIIFGKVENWESMKTGIPKNMPIAKFPHYDGFPKIDVVATEWATIMQEDLLQGNPVPAMDEIWSIIFTSGTTGTPKGAYFKQDKVTMGVNMPLTSYWLMLDENQDNRFFSYLPLNHLAERSLQILAIRFGGEMFFAENLETFAQNLQYASPTTFLGVPRIWTKFKQGILAKMPQKRLDLLLRIPVLSGIVKKKLQAALGLDKARICITGAAPMTPHDVNWWVKLGIPLTEAFGQTETFAHAAYAPVGGMKPGKVGRAHEGMEIRIEETTNEILIKTPLVMDGYYNDPEKTAETIRNGWLYTGDAGKLHDDGYLSITGRVKDTFKSEKGQFIVPTKIEHQYSSNSDIEQMCLLGLGMPQPVMVVVPSEMGAAKPKDALEKSLEEIMDKVNKDLAKYTKVGTVLIAKEPFTPENDLLTPTLKIKRFNVHNKYANQLRGYCEDKRKIIWE